MIKLLEIRNVKEKMNLCSDHEIQHYNCNRMNYIENMDMEGIPEKRYFRQ